MEELQIISKWFKAGQILLDIGANVGNHTIFICKILKAKQSIVIEPNPPAIEILKENIDLNDLHDVVDTSLLGVGLSDTHSKASMSGSENNLGGTRVRSGVQGGTIDIVPGDSILRGRKIDFIKMDVEGLELNALKGLHGLIGDNRPRMFVEVENKNIPDFNDIIESLGYVVRDNYKRYEANENYLIVPRETT